MTGRIENTVFISYRRTNFWTALAVFQNLTQHGYDVFLDYRSIPSGDFEQVITENIKSRAHFIVILSPSAIDRLNESGDWLRREIETAIDYKRNIIPLIMEGFDFGGPTTAKALIGKLANLKKYNALSIPAEYFEEAMAKLRSERFLTRALDYIPHPISDVSRQITQAQKSAAKQAPVVEKEQINAQELFERGYQHFKKHDCTEAIRLYTEAINMEANYALAYSFRGVASALNGDFKNAVSDCKTAIRISPDNADLYFLSYVVHQLKNSLRSAIADLSRAIRLTPDDAELQAFRGRAFADNNQLEKAIADYSAAIGKKPNVADVYNDRGLARSKKNDLDGALEDYTQAIGIEKGHIHGYFNRALIWEKKRVYESAIADYQKYLSLGGGEEEGDQKEVQERIKLLKRKLTNKLPARKKAKQKMRP